MNHGPDEKGPERLDPDLDGFDPDELALRRMLHSAVDDIEPRTGTLDHLRRAVPARRARKRQAVVGMAAAALFIGTAIPALVHVSHSGGSDPNTAMAGQSSQAQGGTGQGKDKGAATAGTPDAGSTSVQPGKETGKPDEKGKDGGGQGGGTGGADPSASQPTGTTPLCTAAQLGSATGTADAPDSAGIVYGTFRVTNISSTACTVGGAGTIGATAQGAADPAKIVRAQHVAGDAATMLPDPSLEVAALVLKPGAAYEEKFAFVPSETCPPTNGSTDGSTTGGPSPDPTSTEETGASGSADSGSASSGTTTQLATEDGTADGSVLISHSAQPGSPTTSTVVSDVCAGTVYYTGVLAGA